MGMKPQEPSKSGRHYADDAATPDPLGVSRDSVNNEWASDRPYHQTGLAGDNGHEGGRQFASDFKSYGSSVGEANSVERISVDTSRADRGKES